MKIYYNKFKFKFVIYMNNTLQKKFICFSNGFKKNVYIFDIIKCNYSVCKEFNISTNGFVSKSEDKNSLLETINIIKKSTRASIIIKNKRYDFDLNINNNFIKCIDDNNLNKLERSVFFGNLKNTNEDLYDCNEATIRYCINKFVELIEANFKTQLIFIRNDSICIQTNDDPNDIINLLNNTFKYIQVRLEEALEYFYQNDKVNDSIGQRFMKDNETLIYKTGIYKNKLDDEILNIINMKKQLYENPNKNIFIDTREDKVIRFKHNYTDKIPFTCSQNNLAEEIWTQKENCFLQECIEENSYLFFDIDITDEELITKLTHYTLLLDQIEIFKKEINKLILNNKFSIEFAISYNIRKEKISIHLVSINVKFNTFEGIKNRLKNTKLNSLLSKFIDYNVYRKNGLFRTAQTYKKKDDKLNPVGDDFLIAFNYNQPNTLYSHLITKMSSLDYYLIPDYIFLNCEYNEEIVESNYYTNYKNVVDLIIIKFFNYETIISEYNKFFIFCYLVAAITEGSFEYQMKLKNICEESPLKNKTKYTTLRYCFNTYKKYLSDHSLKHILDYYLNKANILSVSKYNNVKSKDLIDNEPIYVESKYLDGDIIELDRLLNKEDNINIFIKSSMGTGKTKILLDLLKKVDMTEHKCLIVATRLTMIEEYIKRLKENDIDYVAVCSKYNFENELIKFNEKQCNVFITTCESIFKVFNVKKDFSFIVLDEIESINTQFISKQTHDQNLYNNQSIFEFYLANTNLLVMDGLLTNKTRENILDLKFKSCMKKSINYTFINTFINEVSITQLKSIKDLFKVIYKHDNYSIFITTDSKILSITLYEVITNRTYKEYLESEQVRFNSKIIVFNSDTSKLIDINKLNMLGKIFIYTPSIDVSVSIDTLRVDVVIGFFINPKLNNLIKCQMLMRARNVKEIYLFTNDFLFSKNKNELYNEFIFDEIIDIAMDEENNNQEFSIKAYINSLNKIDSTYITKFKDNLSSKSEFIVNIYNNEIYKQTQSFKSLLGDRYINLSRQKEIARELIIKNFNIDNDKDVDKNDDDKDNDNDVDKEDDNDDGYDENNDEVYEEDEYISEEDKYLLEQLQLSDDLSKLTYKYFLTKYKENKDYYYLYIYYENIIKEISDIYEQQKDFIAMTDIIKNYMASLFIRTKINKNSGNKKIIDSSISLIFDIENMMKKDNISLDELKDFLYNNIYIKLYINIVKSNADKFISLILFSFTCVFNEKTNNVSLAELITYYKSKFNNVCKKIDHLTKKKLNNIIIKNIGPKTNIEIID